MWVIASCLVFVFFRASCGTSFHRNPGLRSLTWNNQKSQHKQCVREQRGWLFIFTQHCGTDPSVLMSHNCGYVNLNRTSSSHWVPLCFYSVPVTVLLQMWTLELGHKTSLDVCEAVTSESIMLGQHLNKFIAFKGVELPHRINERSPGVLEICMELAVEW